MKTSLTLKLLALLTLPIFVCQQVRADTDDGIAANALAARHSIKATGYNRVAQKETGIKAPSGTLISPVIENADAPANPVPRMRPTQEQYHVQQSY